MKKGFLKNFLAVATLSLAITACNLDYFQDATFGDFVWDPSLAIPVGEISYSVEELFEELNDAGAQITTNDENVVTLVYTEALQSQTATAFLSILDQSFQGEVVSGVDVSNPGIVSTIDVENIFEFDLSSRGDEAYDSINFNGGMFNVTLTSEIDAVVDFTLTVNSFEARADDTPLTISGTLTEGNPTFTSNSNLADFDGNFTRDAAGATSRNKAVVTLAYSIAVEPNTVITAQDFVRFDIGVNNAQFSQVFGDVGTQALEVNFQVVNLDFFRNFDTGSIRFAEPKLSFNFLNGFGFPIGIDFREISAIGGEGQIVNLSGTATASPTVVNAPTVNEIGTTVSTTLELNSTNSNIADMLSIQPTKVIMEVSAETNPATTDQYNFVDTGSLLDVNVDVEVPLFANIDDLLAEQEVDFDNGGDLEEAKRLMLRIITGNELPMGGDIELVFQDANQNTVFTVAERPVFLGAAVGGDGRTSTPATNTTDVEFSDDDIRAIEGATRILVRARLSTTDAQSGNAVRLFEDYELRIRLAAQADVEIGTSN